jgi:hypothetical protein
MDLVVGFKAQFPQSSGYLKSLGFILLVGQECIVRQLEELPLFIHLPHLSVHNLGHLLDLRMNLKQLTTADSRLVGVLLATSGEELVDSSHLGNSPFY